VVIGSVTQYNGGCKLHPNEAKRKTRGKNLEDNYITEDRGRKWEGKGWKRGVGRGK